MAADYDWREREVARTATGVRGTVARTATGVRGTIARTATGVRGTVARTDGYLSLNPHVKGGLFPLNSAFG